MSDNLMERARPGDETPLRKQARKLLARVVARLNVPDDGSDQMEAWAILETALQSEREAADTADAAGYERGFKDGAKVGWGYGDITDVREAAAAEARRAALEEAHDACWVYADRERIAALIRARATPAPQEARDD